MRAVLRFLGSRWFLSFIGVPAGRCWSGSSARSWRSSNPGSRAPASSRCMLLIWARREFPGSTGARKRNDDALVDGVAATAADPSIAASRRRSRGDARQTHQRADAVEEGLGIARLPVRAAVVRHHRPARRRQDHRAAERRPEVSARRRNGPGRRSPASAAPACATGGSPTTPC